MSTTTSQQTSPTLSTSSTFSSGLTFFPLDEYDEYESQLASESGYTSYEADKPQPAPEGRFRRLIKRFRVPNLRAMFHPRPPRPQSTLAVTVSDTVSDTASIASVPSLPAAPPAPMPQRQNTLAVTISDSSSISSLSSLNTWAFSESSLGDDLSTLGSSSGSSVQAIRTPSFVDMTPYGSIILTPPTQGDDTSDSAESMEMANYRVNCLDMLGQGRHTPPRTTSSRLAVRTIHPTPEDLTNNWAPVPRAKAACELGVSEVHASASVPIFRDEVPVTPRPVARRRNVVTRETYRDGLH